MCNFIAEEKKTMASCLSKEHAQFASFYCASARNEILLISGKNKLGEDDDDEDDIDEDKRPVREMKRNRVSSPTELAEELAAIELVAGVFTKDGWILHFTENPADLEPFNYDNFYMVEIFENMSYFSIQRFCAKVPFYAYRFLGIALKESDAASQAVLELTRRKPSTEVFQMLMKRDLGLSGKPDECTNYHEEYRKQIAESYRKFFPVAYLYNLAMVNKMRKFYMSVSLIPPKAQLSIIDIADDSASKLRSPLVERLQRLPLPLYTIRLSKGIVFAKFVNDNNLKILRGEEIKSAIFVIDIFSFIMSYMTEDVSIFRPTSSKVEIQTVGEKAVVVKYSISASGFLSGMTFRQTTQLVDFSTSTVLDCESRTPQRQLIRFFSPIQSDKQPQPGFLLYFPRSNMKITSLEGGRVQIGEFTTSVHLPGKFDDLTLPELRAMYKDTSITEEETLNWFRHLVERNSRIFDASIGHSVFASALGDFGEQSYFVDYETKVRTQISKYSYSNAELVRDYGPGWLFLAYGNYRGLDFEIKVPSSLFPPQSNPTNYKAWNSINAEEQVALVRIEAATGNLLFKFVYSILSLSEKKVVITIFSVKVTFTVAGKAEFDFYDRYLVTHDLPEITMKKPGFSKSLPTVKLGLTETAVRVNIINLNYFSEGTILDETGILYLFQFQFGELIVGRYRNDKRRTGHSGSSNNSDYAWQREDMADLFEKAERIDPLSKYRLLDSKPLN
jgi:hypothetical protein